MPIPFRHFWFIFLLILAVSPTYLAQAHGDEPRLEISVERVNPGGVVDVRGVDFEPEEIIDLALFTNGFDYPLGQIVADQEGIFLQTITLPSDLTEGEYQIRAVTDDHELVSPTLTVSGAALSGEEAGEPVRDEDDPLLAPMPTFAPGVVPGGLAQAVPEPDSKDEPSVIENWAMIVLSIVVVLAVFTALRLRAVRKVRS